jgi:hypothetical protein
VKLGDALHAAVTTVTKDRTAVQKNRLRNEARGAHAEARYWRASTREISIRDAAFEVMPADVGPAERVRTLIETFIRHTKGRWAGERFVLLAWQWSSVSSPPSCRCSPG